MHYLNKMFHIFEVQMAHQKYKYMTDYCRMNSHHNIYISDVDNVFLNWIIMGQ